MSYNIASIVQWLEYLHMATRILVSINENELAREVRIVADSKLRN